MDREQPPDLVKLQIELELTRKAFHKLLQAVPQPTWNERGVSSAWTIKQELWHIAWGMSVMLTLIRNARRGIGLPSVPLRVLDPINAFYTKLRSMLATRESIARKYDTVHAAVINELATMDEHDWGLRTKVFGEVHDLFYLFDGITHHFEEHAARIRPLLPDGEAESS